MIYIICPEKLATGGTELLHQFYYNLKKINSEIRIYYYNYSNSGSPVPERFLKYDVEYVTQLIDSKDNFIIFPEVATSELRKYTKSKKSIWWMSVDNYHNSFGFGKNPFSNLKKIIKKYFRSKYIFRNEEIIHFVQSKYAFEFLHLNNVKKVSYLTDYIGSNILEEYVSYSSVGRKNIILYNPKKGFEFTKKVIDYMKNYDFFPLENLTQDEIVNLCKTSKIYIDFGNHPGKDRFPRESAYLGCAVITGLRGSAKYKEDILIDDKYKLEDIESNIPKIKEIVDEIFDNYDELIKDFYPYIEKIKGEEKVFNNEVKEVYKIISSNNQSR